VDQEGDGWGDVCDLSPADIDVDNELISETDAATVIDPAADTTLSTPDDQLSVTIEAGRINTESTFSIVKRASVPGDFQVIGNIGSSSSPNLVVLSNYELQIGGVDGRAFSGDQTVTLEFVYNARTENASRMYRNGTMAVWTFEDTNADGLEDTYVEIPNCITGRTSSDGRCSTTRGLDNDGDGTYDELVLSAPVPRF